MPIPTKARTGSLIAGTVMAALGLNLGVLGIEQASTESATTESAGDTSTQNPVAPAAVPAAADGIASVIPVALIDPGAPGAESAASDPATGAATVGAAARSSGHSDVDGRTAEDTTVAGDRAERGEPDSAPITTSDRASETTGPAGTAPTVTGSAPEATDPVSPSPPSTAPPTTGSTPAPTSGATATVPAPVTEYLTYEFDGVATIIVALHDGRWLEFWSAIPEPGWVFRVDDDEARKVKIKFRPLDGGDEAEFEVKLEDGGLKVKQEH